MLDRIEERTERAVLRVLSSVSGHAQVMEDQPAIQNQPVPLGVSLCERPLPPAAVAFSLLRSS